MNDHLFAKENDKAIQFTIIQVSDGTAAVQAIFREIAALAQACLELLSITSSCWFSAVGTLFFYLKTSDKRLHTYKV